MQEYLEKCQSNEAKRYIKSDFRKGSFIGDGPTADIRRFEIETGLNCGRNGKPHIQKVKDLKRQINKTLNADIPEADKNILKDMLNRLNEVDK